MSYGPEDCLRDLKKICDGTASEDEQASLDFYLLDLLNASGSRVVTQLLHELPSEQLGTLTVSESAARVLHTFSRSSSPPLLIATSSDPDMAWVDVRVESASAASVPDDPRHVAFYAVWERFVESDATGPDTSERAVFLIGLLESEVMNGGFGQYLTNTNGVHLTETLACLEEIGASRTRELLMAAAELGAQAESYVAAWDDEVEAFSRLDGEFYESGEDLAGLTADRFLDLEAG